MTIYNKRKIDMDRDKLKIIYKNLKSLCNALESEIYSDPEAYTSRPKDVRLGFDLSCDDDDGYPD